MARSRADLEAVLARRGVPAEVADRVLDRFTELGLIDDVAYAQALVRTRHRDRGLARRALAHELRRHGIAEGDAATGLSQLDGEQELTTARELASKRAGRYARLPMPTAHRRLSAMLARKGYNSEVISRAVRDALAAHDADLQESPGGNPQNSHGGDPLKSSGEDPLKSSGEDPLESHGGDPLE